MSNVPKRKRKKSTGEELRFRIDAYTPAKIPMLRLAEYMNQLAIILGEPAQVHFRELARGSTNIVVAVEHEAVPKVHARVASVKRGEGPSEAQRAYSATNKMLREDNAIGALRAKAEILQFPGREETQEEFASVRQIGSFDGILTSVGGKDQTAHIILLVEGRQISGFYTNRALAKQLAARWDEPVRLFGRGRWRRDSEGLWSLIDFKVQNFEPLDDASLSTAVADLRSIPTELSDEAYSELAQIRHGPASRGNGSH